MGRFAVIVPQRLCDLAYDCLVENLEAIVDDILDEGENATIVISSDLRRAEIVTGLLDYIPQEEVRVLSVC